MSQTGNVSARQVGDELFNANWNFSLNSTESRDAARKPSGNISLSSFRNWCWTQGRQAVQAQSGNTVRPYLIDTRADGSSWGSGHKWRTGLSGGLPFLEAEVRPNKTSTSGSITGQSFFKATTSGGHALTFNGQAKREALASNNVVMEAYVIQFSAGYLSGSRVSLTSAYTISYGNGVWSNKDYTVPFSPSAGWYVTPVFSIRWPAYTSGILDWMLCKISNARITV